MKKKYLYIGLFTCLCFLMFSNPVLALDTEVSVDNFCSANGIKLTLKIVGYLIYIVKIVIPIVLIIYGMIDVGKIIIGKPDELSKSLVTFAKRCIAAILIFFVPGLIYSLFSMLTDDFKTGATGDYKTCFDCLFYPTDDSACSVQKYGG